MSFNTSIDFTNGLEGWEAEFADYPAGAEGQFQLSSELALLPSPLDNTKPAFKVSGTNQSDDLLMFIYREFTGLRPNTEYAILFQVQIASQYPESSVGIGGSPGSSVYLKAGAKGEAPVVQESSGGMMRLSNYDLGNQSTGGDDGIVMRTIGIEGEDFEWTLIESDNSTREFFATSDDQGRLWFLFGTDSGFEGNTTVYYNRLTINLAEVQ